MKRATHRCMALLIAISILLSMVISVTAVAVNDASSATKDEAALQSAMDLNADGKITVFDAQMLAESNAGLRQLSNDQLDALGTLTVSDIVDYVLGRYKMPTQT